MPFEITAYVPKVAPGVYQAVCTAAETRAAKDGSGDFRVWEFTLRDGTGRTVGATSSMSTTSKSKAGKWLTALLGHAPQVGETVEPVGKPCTIIVDLNDDGYERVAMVSAPEGGVPQSPVRPIEDRVQDDKAVSAAKVEAQTPDDLPF